MQYQSVIGMKSSFWHFNAWKLGKDSDWGEDDSSGISIQPDHGLNVTRPHRKPKRKKKRHMTDAECKTCHRQLVNGSCESCDWGDRNISERTDNYPRNVFRDDKAGIRAGKVGNQGYEGDPMPNSMTHPESVVPKLVAPITDPVNNNPANYQSPHTPNDPFLDTDVSGLTRPLPEWRKQLIKKYPETRNMTEAETHKYFNRTPIKDLLARGAAYVHVKEDDPVVAEEFGPDDWYYQIDRTYNPPKFWVMWPARNESFLATKEQLDKLLATESGQMRLDIPDEKITVEGRVKALVSMAYWEGL